MSAWCPGPYARDPYLEKVKAKQSRDVAHGAKIAREGVAVGDVFPRWINQADRDCVVFAVSASGMSYAYEYEMPNGRLFVRVVNRVTQKERPVSELAMPKWVRPVVEAAS